MKLKFSRQNNLRQNKQRKVVNLDVDYLLKILNSQKNSSNQTDSKSRQRATTQRVKTRELKVSQFEQRNDAPVLAKISGNERESNDQNRRIIIGSHLSG